MGGEGVCGGGGGISQRIGHLGYGHPETINVERNSDSQFEILFRKYRRFCLYLKVASCV